MISEHERETAFLRQCVLYDDTAEHQQLEEKIAQAQRDERCVQRAMLLMAVLAALAVAGLCYSAVFLDDYPQSITQFMTHYVSKVFCALGLGSFICMLAFVGLGVVKRKELDQRREECRRLATKLMESRLGKPPIMPSPGTVEEREIIVNGSAAVVSAREIVELPQARCRSQSFS